MFNPYVSLIVPKGYTKHTLLRKNEVYKCKYCKGMNLKDASKGNYCLDCGKTSYYLEKL